MFPLAAVLCFRHVLPYIQIALSLQTLNRRLNRRFATKLALLRMSGLQTAVLRFIFILPMLAVTTIGRASLSLAPSCTCKQQHQPTAKAVVHVSMSCDLWSCYRGWKSITNVSLASIVSIITRHRCLQIHIFFVGNTAHEVASATEQSVLHIVAPNDLDITEWSIYTLYSSLCPA